MSCDVGHRRGSDSALLWLWYRLAEEAPIPPLPWELPYVTGAAIKCNEKKFLNNKKIYPKQEKLKVHDQE